MAMLLSLSVPARKPIAQLATDSALIGLAMARRAD